MEKDEEVRLRTNVRRGVPADASWFGSVYPHEALRSFSWIPSRPLDSAPPPVID